jgi:replicative DNA helicase
LASSSALESLRLNDSSLLAERSVIGSLILDNDVYDRISDVLTPQDFFHPSNKLIYRHIQKLASDGKAYDLVTLFDSLQSEKLGELAGGSRVIVKFSVWLKRHFVYPVLFCLLHAQRSHQ